MPDMRIIGGEFRGRRLHSPPEDAQTRPMPSRVRESLFGLFRGHTQNALIFDSFSGTGSFGLEAISRGAQRVVFVERDKSMARVLRQNAEYLGVLDRIEIFEGDALGPGALARCPRPATLILLDPPYPLVRDPLGWQRVKSQAEKLVQCLADDGYLILRVPHPFHFESAETAPATPAAQLKRKKVEKRWSLEEAEREERSKLRRAKQRAPKPSESIENVDLSELTDEELDALDAADMTHLTVDQHNQPVPVQLAGALGPETHIYGTMAVHLYMRAR